MIWTRKLLLRLAVRVFTVHQRRIIRTACINHGCDVSRTHNNPEPSFDLARLFDTEGWLK